MKASHLCGAFCVCWTGLLRALSFALWGCVLHAECLGVRNGVVPGPLWLLMWGFGRVNVGELTQGRGCSGGRVGKSGGNFPSSDAD